MQLSSSAVCTARWSRPRAVHVISDHDNSLIFNTLTSKSIIPNPCTLQINNMDNKAQGSSWYLLGAVAGTLRKMRIHTCAKNLNGALGLQAKLRRKMFTATIGPHLTNGYMSQWWQPVRRILITGATSHSRAFDGNLTSCKFKSLSSVIVYGTFRSGHLILLVYNIY